MSRYTGPDCRQCRREGTKLYLKGDKCYSEKCVVVKRPSVPGVHAGLKKKPTEYSVQLREKQKAKRIYGLSEKQFHKYYTMAERLRGATGANMFVLIERRLDNVIYRMGIGVSRSQARQIVNHGHITVNGKCTNIPSYLIKANDVIAVKETKREIPFFKELKEAKVSNSTKWLEFTPALLTGKITRLPTREDIDMSINEQTIVELYSK